MINTREMLKTIAEFFPGTSENEFCQTRNEKNTTIFSTTELNVEESDRMPLFPATQN